MTACVVCGPRPNCPAASRSRPSRRDSAEPGCRSAIELVAGVIGGGLIGYGLDRWLETWPILFVVFFFLGAAAGTLNAYRYIRRASIEAERDQHPR